MPKVSFFEARDLAPCGNMDQLAAALSPDLRTDVHFVHALAAEVAQVPSGLVRGRNLFGPGESPRVSDPFGRAGMREVTSVVLNDAGFEAHSMTVLDRDLRLFVDGVRNLSEPSAIADFDLEFHRDEAGGLHIADDWRQRAAYFDCTALPVCGLGFKNYGHFLFDGLPGVLEHIRLFGHHDLRIVGQKLSPWQHDIIAALGLESYYMEIDTHAVFRKLLTTTLLSQHVAFPTGLIRSMFDSIRFRFGVPTGRRDRAVYLSRAGDTTRRVLRNRAEVEAVVAGLGFEIIIAENLTFAEQARLLASCRVVVGESGAAMANVGFCQPGTMVMEIQPERFPEGWVRGMCFLLSHNWHLYLAAVDSPGTDDGSFSYVIDTAELVAAISVMFDNAH